MKSKKIFAIIAGVLLISSAIIDCVYSRALVSLRQYLNYSPLVNGVCFAIQIFGLAAIGITLLCGRISKGTVTMSGVYAIGYTIDFIRNLNLYSFNTVTLNYIPMLISILYLVCSIMVILKKIKLAKLLSFIPIGLHAIYAVITFNYECFYNYKHLGAWRIILVSILIAYIFLALYINSIKITEDVVTQSLTQGPSAGDGTADKLLEYKELLDAGIISQEEFDSLKKN